MTDNQGSTSTNGSGTTEQQAPPAVVVKDTANLRKQIAAAGKKIAQLKDDRTEINADIQAALESLKAKGIPKDALKRAISDSALDEEQRDNLDLAYVICRGALGKPIQQDMFEGAAKPKH